MIKNRTPFYFIRHGETEHNRLGLLAGGGIDVPLNATGRAQAQNAAELLHNFYFKTILVSPMQRAMETARIIATLKDREIKVIDELRECGIGSMEGKPYTANDSWMAYVQRWREGFTYENAESYKDFKQRVLSGVNEALAHEGPVLIVAHGAVGAIVWDLLGLEVPSLHNAIPYRLEPHNAEDQRWQSEQLSQHAFDEID